MGHSPQNCVLTPQLGPSGVEGRDSGNGGSGTRGEPQACRSSDQGLTLPSVLWLPPQGDIYGMDAFPMEIGPSLLKAKLLAGLLAEAVSLDSTDTD